jgi:ribosomal protein S18 acetylase RimI-like enzyme
VDAPDGMHNAMRVAIEESAGAYLLSYGGVSGAHAHHDERLAWVDSGVAMSDFNSVAYARFSPEEADAGIESVLTHFRAHGRPLTWHIGPSSEPADLASRLMARGMTHDDTDDEPGMAVVIDAARLDFARPDGLVVEPVRDARQLAEWVAVWLFPVSADLREVYFDVLHRRGFGDDRPWRFYLGRVAGEPVACAELFMHRGVAGVQHVVTLPALRRRGIGAAMTRHVLREGQARGCEIAALTASPAGIGIYRRLGFAEYCKIYRYEWVPEVR